MKWLRKIWSPSRSLDKSLAKELKRLQESLYSLEPLLRLLDDNNTKQSATIWFVNPNEKWKVECSGNTYRLELYITIDNRLQNTYQGKIDLADDDTT